MFIYEKKSCQGGTKLYSCLHMVKDALFGMPSTEFRKKILV